MKVLFLCVANSARSQIAEGLGKASGFFEVCESAGSNPSGSVRPLAIEAMKVYLFLTHFLLTHSSFLLFNLTLFSLSSQQEIGIDITTHTSKALSSFDLNSFDFVITLCAEEICPAAFVRKDKHLHWPVEDPAGDFPGETAEQKLERFRKAREEIDKKLKDFIKANK